jgi:hypothetical protein
MTMRKLGRKGRFANQVFQYAYLRQESKGDYQCPAWDGQELFGLDDPVPTRGATELTYKFPKHSRYYDKRLFRRLFRFDRKFSQPMDDVINGMRKGHTLVGLHLRRGDYGTFKRKSARWCFVAPVEWYLACLDELKLNNPLLFIASEEAEHLSAEFNKHNYETYYWNKDFRKDFYTLTQCRHLLISNSTFGFAASMLNKSAKSFWRPRLSEKKLIPDAQIVFKDELYKV